MYITSEAGSTVTMQGAASTNGQGFVDFVIARSMTQPRYALAHLVGDE